MSPIWESSDHLEGYVLVVESDVEGVVFSDCKPFGSGGYPVLTGLDAGVSVEHIDVVGDAGASQTADDGIVDNQEVAGIHGARLT